jgi:hypothetical protein
MIGRAAAAVLLTPRQMTAIAATIGDHFGLVRFRVAGPFDG